MTATPNSDLGNADSLGGSAAGALCVEPDFGPPPCPWCGSTRIRMRSIPFQVNIVARVVLGVGAFLSFWQFWIVALVLSSGLLIALFALPVTAWNALTGWHRCRRCGRPFRSLHRHWRDGVAPEFLQRWFIAGAVVLFLLCPVVPSVLQGQAGGIAFGLPILSLTIECVVFAWLSAACQVVVYLLLRRRVKRKLVWGIHLFLPALILGGRSVYQALPVVRAREVLAYIGTATLPPSARQIRIRTIWRPDQADAYVRFTADPDDINRFLATSPILEGVGYEDVTQGQDERMRPERENAFVLPDSGYFVEEDGPQWFGERLTVSTRRYYIPLDDEGLSMTALHLLKNSVAIDR